jgi:two-component system NtrC family sensor kinase
VSRRPGDREDHAPSEPQGDALLRDLFHLSPVALLLADAQSGTILDANQAACDLVGMPRDELVGLDQASIYAPQHAQEYSTMFRKHIRGRRVAAEDILVHKPTGEVIPVRASAEVLDTPGKQVVRWVLREIADAMSATDDSEPRSDQLAALNTIATTVAGSLSFDEIMRRSLDTVLQLLNLEAGSILLTSADQDSMVLAAHRGLGTRVPQLMDQFLSGRLLTAALYTGTQTILMDDLAQNPRLAHLGEALQKGGFGSIAAVPLVAWERGLGVLAVATQTANRFSPQDVELLSSIGIQIGLAVENAALHREQEQRLSEMEALRKTTLDISRQLDVPLLLQSIVERASALMGTTGGGLYLYHEDDEELELIINQQLCDDYTGTRLKLGEGLSGKVALTGEPMLVEDYVNWEGRSPKYEGVPFGAIAAVPLKWGDRILGVVNVTDLKETRAFTERDLRLLELFANQAAIAIENARLHDQTKKRLEELSAIEEIVGELASTLDLAKVIRTVLDKAVEATDASAGSIDMVTEDGARLVWLAHRGYPQAVADRYAQSSSTEKGIVGRVARTGELSLVHDVNEDPDYARVIPDTRSQLTVPIIIENAVAGVIVLESPRLGGFGREHAEFVRHLAEHAAVAMGNAQLYERLRISEERYRAYVESVPDAIWEADAEGHFTYWSPQVESLTGYAPEELLGGTPYDILIHPDQADTFKHRLVQMMRDGKEEFTLRHGAIHKDGSPLHLELSIKPVRDDSGRLVNYRGVTRDVSSQARLQAQLIQSAKLSGIGQMISGVAHELNNPLTTVIGYTQLLQASDVDDNVKADLQRIYDGALRAQRIVQNLLTFARQKKPQRTPTDLNEVIEHTMTLRGYHLKVDNVEVVTALEDDLPWTMADSYQLEQVFLNIINNAHQAMSQAAGQRVLTVKSELADPHTIRVTVTDTGPGMSTETLDRVFDPFFTTKDVGLGTGLGMSVSHGIVQEHGGRIWAESVLGEGATFVVELPVKHWAEDMDTQLSDDGLAPTDTDARRILIIDDEENVVDLMVKALADSGYLVEGVTSADSALDRLRRGQYGLIISDVRMPGMDGPACEKEVRAMNPDLAERIIYVTGDVLGSATQAFLKGKEGRCLRKPFAVEELKRAVRQFLG